ncbi:MAG TPA: hypothetical protein VKK79_22065 [Candidatus Lokiarchaeia archaeon]|nr:hypothetical protein [Candidatus Lokiarchaeia archaeon]
MALINDLIYSIKVCWQAINVLIALEIAFFTLIRQKKPDLGAARANILSTKSTTLTIGLFFFFLFSALGLIFYTLELPLIYQNPATDFTVPGTPLLVSNIKAIFFIFAFASFLLVLVRSLTRIRVWIPFLIVLAAFPALLAAPAWVFGAVVYVFVPLCLLLFMIFWNFVEMTSGRLRRQFLAIFIGIITFLVGCVTLTHALDPLVQLSEYPITEPIIFVSLLCMGYGFFSIPSLNEAFARAFIEELYITTREGKIVLRHSFLGQDLSNEPEKQTEIQSGGNNPLFLPPQDSEEQEFFASTFTGIGNILQEISRSEGGVTTLHHQNKILVSERASLLVGILVARMDLPIYRPLLSNLLHEIEATYLGELYVEKFLSPETRGAMTGKIDNYFKFELKGINIPTNAPSHENSSQNPPNENKYRDQVGTTSLYTIIAQKLSIKSSTVLFFAIFLPLTIAEFIVLSLDMPNLLFGFQLGLVDPFLFNGLILVIYFLNRKLIWTYKADLRTIEQRLNLPPETDENIKVFSKAGYVILVPIAAILFLLYAFVEFVVVAHSPGAYVLFVINFLVLDGIIGVEFLMALKQFLKARLFLME